MPALHARRARLLQKLNRGVDVYDEIRFIRTHPFGPKLEVDHYQLGNGLEILLLEDASAPVISFHLWFRVGSRHETPGKTGLAHLFEHLMFNEVEGLPPGAFDQKMEAVGADNNASTWLDFTQYQEAFPKQHLSTIVDLEARRMHQLVLRKPQVDSEKEVVKNERLYRVDDDVDGYIEELLYKTAFAKHAYHWPTIGWMSDIENFTVEDCEAFYREHYAPNNATLVMVGDFTSARALELIRTKFGPIPTGAIPEENIQPEPVQTQERRVSIEQPTSSAKLVVGYKGPALGDHDHVTLSLLVEIMTGGKGSIFYQELVRQREVASDVSGFVGPHHHPSLIEISASARDHHTATVLLEAIDGCIEKLKTDPVSVSTLQQAQNRMELASLFPLESADGKASSIGFYHTLLGRPGMLFDRLDAARRVTVADLRFVARRYLNAESRTVILVSPSTETRPESTETEAS